MGWNGWDGLAYASSNATLTININSINDAPAGIDTGISLSNAAQYTFSTGIFGYTDTGDTPANAFSFVKITTLPSSGNLQLNGSNITTGQAITIADIVSGLLKFVPPSNAYGSPYTTFTFQVQDNGGTSNGGVDTDPTPNTITINALDIFPPSAPTLSCTNFAHNTRTAYSGTTTCSINDTALPSPRTAVAYSLNAGTTWINNTGALSFTYTPSNGTTYIIMRISDAGG